jgi:hypothetical protein
LGTGIEQQQIGMSIAGKAAGNTEGVNQNIINPGTMKFAARP